MCYDSNGIVLKLDQHLQSTHIYNYLQIYGLVKEWYICVINANSFKCCLAHSSVSEILSNAYAMYKFNSLALMIPRN